MLVRFIKRSCGALALGLLPWSAMALPVQGTLDAAVSINQASNPTIDTCTAAGWSRDPGNTGATRVDFYAVAPYGQPGSIFVGSTMANQLRSDLPYADKYHGFSMTFPIHLPLVGPNAGWVSMANGTTYNLYAYGIAVSGSSTNALLQGTPKQIKCATNVKHDKWAAYSSTTDHSDRIQQAINQSGANSLIYFPAGEYFVGTNHRAYGEDIGQFSYHADCPNVYNVSDIDQRRINSALVVRDSNVKLAGEFSGSSRPVLKLVSGSKMRILTVASSAQKSGAKDLKFDGNKSGRGASDVNVHWPCGQVVDGLVYNNGNSNAIYSNIHVVDGMEDGFGCWHCSDLTLRSSRFQDNGTASAGATGISISAAGALIEQNTVTGSTAPGIWINGDPGPGQSATVNNITLRQNTLQNNRDGGIQITADGSGMPQNIDIIGNTISGSNGGFAGIYIVGASTGSILENLITDNENAGIQFTSATTSNWSIGYVASATGPTGCRSSKTVACPYGAGHGNNVASTTSAHIQDLGIRLHQGSGFHVKGNTVSRNGTSLAHQILVEAGASLVPGNAPQTDNTLSWY